MVKHKVKKAVAIAMAAAVTLSALPNLSVQYEKKAKAASTEISSADVTSKYNTYFGTSNKKKHVTVHDPSVVIGYTDNLYTGDKKEKIYGEQNDAKSRKKVYFIFGSHRAFAWSTDMQNWNYFTNNINDDTKCKELFKDAFAWSAKGDSVYGWSGNLWAPDIFWDADYVNDDNSKGAWCMYMSINGCSWNSSIVLLTSDDLDGDWTNRGAVVYSGFTESGDHAYTDTDFASVVGENEAKSLISDTNTYKYSDNKGNTTYVTKDGNTNCNATSWNYRYGAHAIDPCVTYDSEGNLWMSYGSWSGGIWMFKLDPATGLRDTKTKYEYKDNETDPYMGYKLAGGMSRSGEASYIEKIGEKYYLFLSYGGLVSTGGYNMRVFSSEKITGPYKDVAGNDARYGSASAVINKNAGGDGSGNTTTGERLMSYYNWHYLDKGRVAQGHNSAVVDDDGKAYVVYHTRFNDGSEGHEVRVHQLFTAENGGIVAAPFEYSGETLADSAYSSSDVAGEYTVIYHKPSVNAGARECCQEQKIKLNEDGTVTGDYTGNWTQSTDKPYVTITAGGVEYKGVFIKQKIEGTGYETMCFTTVGSNNVTFWGTKGYSDEYKVVKDTGELSVNIPAETYNDIELPALGNEGSKITWESSDTSAVSNSGEVQMVSKDTKVTLTATITNGSYYSKKIYNTTIKSLSDTDIESGLSANYTFENGLINEADTSQTGTAMSLEDGKKPDIVYSGDRAGKVLNQYFGYADAKSTSYVKFDNPLKGKNLTGATVSLWVNRQDSDVWDAIWSFFDEDVSDNKSGRVYLTPNTYLGYNGTVNGTNKWFDINHAETVTNNMPVNEWHYVTVSLGTDDFGIYMDGKLICNKSKYTTYGGTAYASAASDMLSVISSSANFYLGYGSWWGSAPLYMDNIRIYSRNLSAKDVAALYKTEVNETKDAVKAEKDAEQAIKDASIFYNSYNYDMNITSTGWSSANASANLTIESDSLESHKNYVQFAPGKNNSRSAYGSFGDIKLTDNYTVEFDAKLSAGNNQASQFALATEDYNKSNSALANTSYLWSLDTTNSTSWTISSGSTASTAKTDTVNIEKDTWTHFKTTIDKINKKVTLEITDISGKVLKTMDIAMNSISDVKGLWYLSGRYEGVAGFDNVLIYEGTSSPVPSVKPTTEPTEAPTVKPSASAAPTKTPEQPSVPTVKPSASAVPTKVPNQPSAPSQTPGSSATTKPTAVPTQNPSTEPTITPSNEPTATPSVSPSTEPTQTPTAAPTKKPSSAKLKSAVITVKNGKKKVSSVTVKRKKTVKLTVLVNSKTKLSVAKLSKKNAKIAKVTFKNNKLTVKGLKKGKISIKITSKKTSKYKAASKTIKVTVK